MRSRLLILVVATIGFTACTHCIAQSPSSAQQREKWLERFPAADTNHDGKLSIDEANKFRKSMLGQRKKPKPTARTQQGAPRRFNVDPGWDLASFPEHAVCYLDPERIKSVYQQSASRKGPAVVSFDKPTDGAIRVVGTGHSFMAPGYKTLPMICEAAGMKQPLYTHTGGGVTGSTRYKWEQENGIFQFEGRPNPKLLSSISNARWDAMMWGPYFNDRPAYYSCWVDFCLKYNPDMKFYLSDAWPQLYQLGKNPESESFFTAEVFDRMGSERRIEYVENIAPLREKYPNKVFVLPTSDAMVLAAKSFLRGELPGIEGVHRVIGKKERSLWRDQLGHIGPGLDRLEGYVFYATLYGKSPELIQQQIRFGGDPEFPSPKLDQTFRKIAWQAVIGHPFSGVKDENGDGVKD